MNSNITNSKQELILLGAGASVEAGVPAAYPMTRKMMAQFEIEQNKRHSRILAFVIGGLIFGETQTGTSPFAVNINIEAVFNALDLLSKRMTLEASPFIGSWDSMVEQLDQYESDDRASDAFLQKLGSFVENEINQAVASFSRSIAGRPQFQSISSSINVTKLRSDLNRALDQLPKPGNGKRFEEVKEIMLTSLQQMVWLNQDAPIKYLHPLFLNNSPRIIATLNYDNTIEIAAKENSYTCKDGLEEWQAGIPILPENLEDKTVYLLRLHGSILWQQISSAFITNSQFKNASYSRATADSHRNPYSKPGVIFGGANKLTHEGPYLEILRTFELCLNKANVLTVVGYSFADAHINSPIARWLERDKDHVLRIVDPNFSSLNPPFIDELISFSRMNPGRLIVRQVPLGLTNAEYDRQVKTFTGDALAEYYTK